MPEEEKDLPYFTKRQVGDHNAADDCWISLNGKVLDLTSLIVANRGSLAQPLIAAAGEDISFWFDKKTGDVKTFIDPDRNLRMPYTPMGRFLHVPPPEPSSDW